MPTVVVTAPPSAASELATRLVEEQLAASVNRLDCRSTYWWEGELHDEPEELLLIRTTAAGYDALADRIVELHPYEVPCIERFDADATHPPFAAWVADVTE